MELDPARKEGAFHDQNSPARRSAILQSLRWLSSVDATESAWTPKIMRSGDAGQSDRSEAPAEGDLFKRCRAIRDIFEKMWKLLLKPLLGFLQGILTPENPDLPGVVAHVLGCDTVI